MARYWPIAVVSLSLFALGATSMGFATEARAQDPGCGTLSAELSEDPTQSAAFSVVGATNVYRFMQRPYARLAAGVKLALRAPQGVTAADLHRSAVCSATRGDGQSPLAVPGVKVRVLRNGGNYELHITSDDPARARDIQQRAALLR